MSSEVIRFWFMRQLAVLVLSDVLSKILQRFMNNNLIGIIYALAAFISWGLLPVYWKLLQQVPSSEILAHRVFWSFVLVSMLLLVKGQWALLKQTLAVKKNRIPLLLSTMLISVNWFLYIWAVNANHIVEASMGYYINPLFSVFLGVVVLRERLNFWQLVSLVIAVGGVLMITVEYGKFPWIALTLAFTFGLYGLAKKIVSVDSLIGLGLETACVAPICLAYIIFKQFQGIGSLGTVSLTITALLIFSGVVTAFPLWWFAQAAKKIPLSRIGFIQYLAPTLMLLLGVIIFKEPFTTVHLISFGCIWCALILYSFSHTAFLNNCQPKRFKNAS
jgi:chloramphenicol-sensitive protein RarD